MPRHHPEEGKSGRPSARRSLPSHLLARWAPRPLTPVGQRGQVQRCSLEGTLRSKPGRERGLGRGIAAPPLHGLGSPPSGLFCAALQQEDSWPWEAQDPGGA